MGLQTSDMSATVEDEDKETGGSVRGRGKEDYCARMEEIKLIVAWELSQDAGGQMVMAGVLPWR